MTSNVGAHPHKVTQVVQALRDADQRQNAAAQTVAGKSDQLATLLDHALRFHEEHGDGDCPVCGHGTTTGEDPRDRHSLNQ